MEKNMRATWPLLLLLVVSLSLSACSDERRELTLHDPGEYKGATDPLLATGPHPELNERFKMIQTDR